MYVSTLGKYKRKFKHTSGFVLETRIIKVVEGLPNLLRVFREGFA